jgi:hypothetical protein
MVTRRRAPLVELRVGPWERGAPRPRLRPLPVFLLLLGALVEAPRTVELECHPLEPVAPGGDHLLDRSGRPA